MKLGGDGGDVETVMEEEGGGNEGGAAVGEGATGEVGVGVLEDEGGEIRVGDGELGGEVAAEAGAHGDDAGGGEVAGVEEVVEGGLSVFQHAGLVGVLGVGLAESAVIDGKEVEVEVVELGECLGGVAEVAGAAVEVEDGGGGSGAGGDVPGGEAGSAGGAGVELDGVKGDGGGGGELGGGMQNELPGALIDEEADGQPGAEERGDDGGGEGFDEPEGIYVWIGVLLGRDGLVADGHGRGSVYDEQGEVRAMAEWVRLCGIAEAPAEGQLAAAEAGGVSVCLSRVGGVLRGMLNVCPHRQAPLAEGWLDGERVVCPWHSWEFDCATGAAVYPEGERVAVFAVKVQGDEVLVNLGEG